jgi:hypothetical protein
MRPDGTGIPLTYVAASRPGRRGGVTLAGRSGLAVLAALVVILPASPARAEDPQPVSTSAATRYQVTFVARSCAGYAQVMANRVRDNSGESAAPLGRENQYDDAQPVDPDVEGKNSGGCQALGGWRFTLGAGHQRKGLLSTITGAPTEVGPTVAEIPLLNATGRPVNGRSVAGAVTATLTGDQIRLAGQRQLWVQGGTPADPLLTGSVPGLAFAALRCGVDGRSGGNVGWITFPAGVRHVFCYAYYVRTPPPTGTVVIRARATSMVSYPQRIPFTSPLSFATGSMFALTTTGEPVDATFTRIAGAYRVTPQTPPGWRLTESTCTATRTGGGAVKSTATVDPVTGAADLHLAGGDVLTCGYGFEPPVDPAGLTVRVVSMGGPATFAMAVDAGPAPVGGDGSTTPSPLTGPVHLSAVSPGDGSATRATGADLTTAPTGTYRVTVTPPGPGWALTGANCDGTEVKPIDLTITVPVAAGTPTACAVRVGRTGGGIRLKVVTAGEVARAAFAVAPATEAASGWAAVATTNGYGVSADAVGDLPATLPAGAYVVTPIAPPTTAEGSWKLSSLGCDPVTAAIGDGGAILVTLSAGTPDVECTASYQFVAATRMQVVLRFEGEPAARESAAVIEVSCDDGSIGRVVLLTEDYSSVSLPEPLTFLEPTRCTVTEPSNGVRKGSTVSLTGVMEPAAGNAPVLIPTAIDVVPESGLLTLTLISTYTTQRAVETRAGAMRSFKALPIALIGSGVFGLGALMLLVILARWRRPAR